MQLKSHLYVYKYIYMYFHFAANFDFLWDCYWTATVFMLQRTAFTCGLTRHSTQMPQNGSRVIGEDSEVPSMSEVKRREKGQKRIPIQYIAEIHTSDRQQVKSRALQHRQNILSKLEWVWCKVYGLLTLKMALTFLWGNHCHVYWCPPSHNALPRGYLSAPQSASTLAARI